jgi:hypothetical protein
VSPLLATAAILCLAVLSAAAGEELPSSRPAAVARAIVTSGEPTPVGGSFDRFDIAGQAIPAPSNRRGEVVFFASLVRSEADEGVFIAAGDSIRKIAAAGDSIPSGERIVDFTARPAFALNAAGAVAFPAALAGGRATAGLFVAAEGKLAPVVLTGAAAPEITGASLTAFEWPVLDDSGNLAFLASMRRGRGSSDAIFLQRGGELRKLVAAGDDAPGGGVFGAFGAPAMNNHGVVAFPAVVEQGPVLGGLFIIENGQVRQALAAGSSAPSGGIFAKFSEQVAIDDAGTIAFSAVLRQGGPATAVFVLDTDAPRAIAATGDPAPGGGVFAAFPSWPVLNRGGTVAFVAAIDDGPNPLAVYIARNGALERLVGIGDRLADGSRLASFARYPAIAIGPDGAVTFAGASERDGELREALFYIRPAPF